MLLLFVASAALTSRAPATLPNFRDLGNTACANGRIVRPGLLLRSASPANISESDMAILGSGCAVLDLRSQHDAEKDVGPRRMAAMTQHVPLISESAVRSTLKKRAQRQPLLMSKLVLLTAAKKLSPSRRLRQRVEDNIDARLAGLLDQVSLGDVYFLIMTERGDEVRSALNVCLEQWTTSSADRPQPMLIHCTHGKDRTGVLVALLLSICGASEDDILADYVQSHDWGCSPSGEWAMWQGLPDRIRAHVQPQTIRDWCEAPETELVGALDRIKEKHGSILAYLETIGVDSAFRNAIAQELTAEAEA